MASAEETPNTEIIFRGIDGNECEAFIVAIRDLAYAKGEDEDPNWMLRFATTRLRGKALRWHLKLDPSIRKNWDLFTQALCEEYPFVEEGDEDGIATPVWTSTTFSPTPSTATLPSNGPQIIYPFAQPSISTGRVNVGISQSTHPTSEEVEHVTPARVYNPSLPGMQIGPLLLSYDESRPGPHYVSASSKRATSNIAEALIVTFLPSSKPHPIGCFNGDYGKLAVQLCSPESSELHRLTSATGPDNGISMSRYSFQCISDIWSISSDGTLNAKLSELVQNSDGYGYYVHSEYYSTTTVYVEISGRSISFTKDHSTPRATYPDSGLPIVRARIVFEPL